MTGPKKNESTRARNGFFRVLRTQADVYSLHHKKNLATESRLRRLTLFLLDCWRCRDRCNHLYRRVVLGRSALCSFFRGVPPYRVSASSQTETVSDSGTTAPFYILGPSNFYALILDLHGRLVNDSTLNSFGSIRCLQTPHRCDKPVLAN